MREKILDIQNLYIEFQKDQKHIYALNGVQLYLYPNEIVGLVGESAAGKSVAGLSIMGLLPENSHIRSGKILYNGKNLLNLSPQQIAEYQGKKIAMIYQDPFSSLNPTMRVGYQVIESMIESKQSSYEEAKKQAITLFEELGLNQPEQLFYQYPHELSGGIRQRIVIAMALICSPDLLIADEPTTALDVTVQVQIIKLLKKIQAKRKMSILFISHDFGVVSHLCDRVMVMYGGQIVEEGNLNEVLEFPQHPYTKLLLQSLPKITDPIQKKLPTIMGSPVVLQKKIKGCTFLTRCPDAMSICQEKCPSMYNHSPTQKSRCWLYKKKDEITSTQSNKSYENV